MKIISIIGQKGGTGKTTLACALAVSSVMDGKTTAAIDLDPQASLCEWADIRGQDTPVITDCQPPRLERVLNTARDGGVDLCLIDTAGRAEVAALSAAKMADLIIIPCQPTIPDIKKVSAALDIVRLAGKGGSSTLVVLTRVKSPLRRKEAADWFTSQSIAVCPHALGERVSFQDAYGTGQSPQEQDSKSKAAKECIQVYMYVSKQLGL